MIKPQARYNFVVHDPNKNKRGVVVSSTPRIVETTDSELASAHWSRTRFKAEFQAGEMELRTADENLDKFLRVCFYCVDCSPSMGLKWIDYEEIGGTGYALESHDSKRRVCYDCVAKRDIEEMRTRSKTVLYLTETNGKPDYVSNWPGTLKMPVDSFEKITDKRGRVLRVLVWFRDPHGNRWGGTNNNEDQLLQCAKLKR